MACLTQNTKFGELLELVAEKGIDGMSEPVAILLNLAMRLEREDYSNGFKPRTIKTRLG